MSFGDWGNLTSIIGLAVSFLGLCWVGFQAWDAKRVAFQTRRAIVDVLVFGSGTRATTLIQELKNALLKGRWEVGYHLCHTLSAMIGDLKMTDPSPKHAQSIEDAVKRLIRIENALYAAVQKGEEEEPKGVGSFNASLSNIQADLEEILRSAALKQQATRRKTWLTKLPSRGQN